MKVIEFYFPQIYDYDELDAQLERIKDKFYDMLQEYASPLQFKSSSLSHSHSGGSEVSTSDVSNDFSKLLQFLSNNSSSTNVKHELEYYLQEFVLPWIEEFDIFSWWKAEGLKYPTLRMIA